MQTQLVAGCSCSCRNGCRKPPKLAPSAATSYQFRQEGCTSKLEKHQPQKTEVAFDFPSAKYCFLMSFYEKHQ